MSETVEKVSNHPAASPRTVTGPRQLPLVGNMFDMQRDRLKFLMELASYGDVSVFRMGPLPIYMVSHPDGVKHILQDNNHNYIKDSPVFDQLRGLLGNGLFLSDGEFWLRQRRLMQPMFHRQRINGFGDIMIASAQRTMAGWRELTAQGRSIDMMNEMMRLTLDVACRSLFSVDVMGAASDIAAAINIQLEDFIFRFDRPFYPPTKVPTPRNRRYLASIQTLDQVVYRMIAERRQASQRPEDLLTLLLEARDEETGEGMTDKQIRDELMTLLLAGHETTAVTLTWALYLLSTYPDVEQRVYAEVESALGGRAATPADLQNMPYTRMVIDETLRLYPPAWVTNRKVVEEDEVCGYRLPKGSVVSVSPFATHRLPEFWDQPEVFNPDRFTPEASKDRHHFAYFPFGGGPRMCIGKSFALMEAPLVLASIVQCCQMTLQPGWQVEMHPLVTLRPKGGLPMQVKFR